MAVYPYTPKYDTPLHKLVVTSKKLSPGSKRLYLSHLDTFAEGMGTSPSDWTHRKMVSFYDRLCERVKPQTANGVIRAVQYALRAYHRDTENVPLGDFARIELHGSAPAEPRKPPSHEEALSLLEACLAEGVGPGRTSPVVLRDFALMVVGLETGLRRFSLANLRWDKMEEIERGLVVAEVPSKGDPAFVVPLSPVALTALQPWKQFCFPSERTKASGFVVRRLTPTPMDKTKYTVGDGVTDQTVYNIICVRAQRAGIRHIHPHLFRHYYSSSRSEALVPPSVIMSVTGHTIPGMGRIASGYVDRRPLWRQAVTTTPNWLSDVVDSFVRSVG